MVLDSKEANIIYRLTFADGQQIEHRIGLLDEGSPLPAVEWTQLSFHQCSHCPLDPAEVQECPLAAALQQPVRLLSKHASYEEVDVQVFWRGRETRQHTTLQRAAGSMLGAIGACSGCPYTRTLKTMAWFHWPLCGTEETLYRVFGSYLLGQYLRDQRGLSADWKLDGLREIYGNLRKVNLGMAKRLRAAAEEDSSVNGLILLDLLAADTQYMLDQYAGELDSFFAAYLHAPD
jgi:hypothetical protein